ncbi:MAG: type II CAAX endopeptidase family protein [Candidatus Melainabacteria bacterium]|nr:type II CAAX endopeptidase family protein [Candidatus Melainabacteria bacterium]
MPTNPSLHTAVEALQVLIVIVGLGALLNKSALKPRLVTALLALCTILVVVVFSSNAANRVKDGKGAAVMEAGQSEFMMRMAAGFKAFSSGLPLAGSKSSDELYKSAAKSMESAVDHDPQSLSLRLKQVVLAAETGVGFADELAAMRGYKDQRAGKSSDLIDAIYQKKTLKAGESVSALALIDELISSGFYREVLKLEVYKVSGQKKVYDQAATEYNDSSRLFAARLVGLMLILAFSGLVGIIVLAVQLVKLPRNLSDQVTLAQIRAPAPYGFTKVYGVLIGWLTLESFLSPAVSFLLPHLKGSAKDPLMLALLTMTIYLVTNLPSLVLAWLIAIKPTGVGFFEAVKLRWRTPTRGPVGLVFAGILTWFACVPMVLASSVLAKNLLRAEGSSNPVLTIIMEAVRSHNAMAAILFVVAVGVLPAICEETLFRGFLYTSLRWRFGAFQSMLLSAFLFSAVHMDPGAFLPLFVLGFAFAFVFERTRSLIPSMIAHCMWNTGTFIFMLSIFG